MNKYTKYGIITLMSFFLIHIMSGSLYPDSAGSGISPQEGLDRLKNGNLRYIRDKRLYTNQGVKTRNTTAEKGQFPFASVLGCSDSRVPVEHIFDAGIGEIFTIRVAGNVSDTDEIGTVEYGVGHLKTPVLVVLGHTKCGAVTAVVKGEKVHGSIPALVDNIIPAVERARKKMGGPFSEKLVDEAIRQNVWQSIEDLLNRSEETRHLISEKKLMVVGGIYHLHNGEIEWLGEHPEQAGLVSHKSAGHGAIIPASILIVNGAILGILAIFFIFFIGKNRIIKGVQVRGRIFASFAALIFAFSFTAVWGIFGRSWHGGGTGTAEGIVNAGISLLISLFFALIYMNSIIGSFKRVIGMLKSPASLGGDHAE